MQLSHLIPENRALRAPCRCDSIGVKAGSLLEGLGIIDLDNTNLAPSIKEALAEEESLNIEKTPSGGLYIWSKGFRRDTPGSCISRAGLRLEYFRVKRITIIGPVREILKWTPPSKLKAGRYTITADASPRRIPAN